jgi:hypothetical protein
VQRGHGAQRGELAGVGVDEAAGRAQLDVGAEGARGEAAAGCEGGDQRAAWVADDQGGPGELALRVGGDQGDLQARVELDRQRVAAGRRVEHADAAAVGTGEEQLAQARLGARAVRHDDHVGGLGAEGVGGTRPQGGLRLGPGGGGVPVGADDGGLGRLDAAAGDGVAAVGAARAEQAHDGGAEAEAVGAR